MAISRERKKAPARKPARVAHRAEKPSARRPARRTMTARRADFGAPVDPFFAKQPPHLRAVLGALRKLVEEAAPEATGSIKWGMPRGDGEPVRSRWLGAAPSTIRTRHGGALFGVPA